jgi:hypothetical protein
MVPAEGGAVTGTNAELEALSSELGGTLPAGFDSLPADRLIHLTSLVRLAKDRQEQMIDEGAEAALSIVPRPLRGAVRRALRG